MSWKELVDKALMGTDWGKFSPALKDELEALGIPGDLPAEQQLLEGAAMLHQLNKAAPELQDYQGKVFIPEEIGEAKPCSNKSSYHLQLILDGRFRPALPEFATLLIRSGKRLPPESLPVLFYQSLTDRRLWRQLRPAVGPVGEWLMRQNPDWDAINPSAIPEDWERGALRARRRFLRRLHESAPGEAIEKLRRTWSEEPYRTKLGLLEILREDPREADIEFLESCLEDARKEVRLAAADILALHATSPLVDRLFQEAVKYLKLSARDELEVTLPGKFEEALRRNGILERPEEKYHTSPRGRRLMQLVARIPPGRWNLLFDRDAAACLRLFTANEFGRGFLLALTEAVNRHGGADWMSAILEYWDERNDESLWKNSAAGELMQQLPDALFNEHLLRYIDREGPLISGNSLACQLLGLGAHWWSERLSLLFIQGFQNWMSDAPPFNHGLRHYPDLLQSAAYRSSTGLLERLRKSWPMTARSWPQWQDEVEAFINILHFRKKMREELERSSQ